MSAQPSDGQLENDVYDLLHKATIEDSLLDQKRADAKLTDDLRLGGNDMIWIAGRLSDLSNGYGGRPIFTSAVEDCDTAGDLIAAYTAVVRAGRRRKTAARTIAKKRRKAQ